jgi:hypothetical protein
MATTEESRSVGLEFRLAYGLSVNDSQMCGPDVGVARRSLPPSCEDRPDVGNKFRLDK